MPRFNLDDIAAQYNALNYQILDARKPIECLVLIKRLDVLIATHFGELLQEAQHLTDILADTREAHNQLFAENEDLQAQLLAAQSGLALPRPRPSLVLIDDLQPTRPPVAEAAGDVHRESDDPNTPDNADLIPD